MSRSSVVVRLFWALACVCAVSAMTAAGAGAVEPHPHTGRLPGFPVIRGVVPVLGSKTAITAREQLVKGAFAAARARRTSPHAAEPNENFQSACEAEFLFLETQDVCYRGGPVLRHLAVHLIFWQGEPGTVGETEVKSFPPEYEEIIERYFEDVATESGAQSNVYAIAPQFGDENAKGEFNPGEYSIAFNKTTDVAVDKHKFPTHLVAPECLDETKYSKGACLFDSDIQKEVTTVATAQHWPAESLENIYLVLTAPGVGGCFGVGSTEECAYKQYCAYHGDFGGDGVTPGNQTIYADLPYLGSVRGCDSGVHPNEEVSRTMEEAGEDGGADALIDTASHELNEAITDPIGSQCETGATEASQCERGAWTDVIGQEVGDKCLPPEQTVAGIYGEPLGELLPERPASLFNQLIAGGHYWTQREWSNEAGVFEGGCVQRMIEAHIAVSANAAATVPVTFDGSASGAQGDQAVYWVWSFGDGEQLGTASATTTHTYPKPGEYFVTLTAFDAYGNARATFGVLTVGSAPPASAPAPAPPPMVVIKEVKVPAAVARVTAAHLAKLLGLPPNGARLAGLGKILFGHAECPPACLVTLKLYAKVTTRSHKRTVTRQVLIGTARVTGTPKGAVFVKAPGPGMRELLVALNAKGRALLRQRRRLPVALDVAVQGQEGGTWTIDRKVTLTR